MQGRSPHGLRHRINLQPIIQEREHNLLAFLGSRMMKQRPSIHIDNIIQVHILALGGQQLGQLSIHSIVYILDELMFYIVALVPVVLPGRGFALRGEGLWHIESPRVDGVYAAVQVTYHHADLLTLVLLLLHLWDLGIIIFIAIGV